MGTRIVRVGWADGKLYGSRYAIARIGGEAVVPNDVAAARARIMGRFDVVFEDSVPRAVA